MEDEALDTRGRNVTLGIFGAIILLIAGLVGNNYRIKLARVDGMQSNVPARQSAAIREMMQGFTNDGHIAEQLQGERPSVRAAAVRALLALAKDGATDAKTARNAARLTVPFLKDSDQPIKDRAQQALTAMGPAIAIEAVTGALGDSDNAVKGGAQSVCQNFAGAALMPLLVFAGEDGAKARLRTAHRTFAGNALYEISKKDDRFKTVALFGQDAVQTPAKGLTPEQAQAELSRLLGLPNSLLANPSEPVFGVVHYLDAAHANEDDQNNAISILDRIGDARAVPFLLPKLDTPTTRRAAVGALGRLGDRRATARLVYYLSRDETNRVEIVIALGRISDPTATAALIQHGLGSVSYPVRAAAADALRNIGVPAIPLLANAARAVDPNDPGFYKAEGAVRALAGMRVAAATQVAIAALQHRADNVREAAAETLDECGDPAAIAPLIAAFRDRDGRVAGFASRSLSAFGIRAVAPLTAALSGRTTVYWASLALSFIGMPAAPALRSLLESPDTMGARAAASLLGDLGDTAAMPALARVLRGKPHPDVQFAAASSLQRLDGNRPSGGEEAPPNDGVPGAAPPGPAKPPQPAGSAAQTGPGTAGDAGAPRPGNAPAPSAPGTALSGAGVPPPSVPRLGVAPGSSVPDRRVTVPGPTAAALAAKKAGAALAARKAATALAAKKTATALAAKKAAAAVAGRKAAAAVAAKKTAARKRAAVSEPPRKVSARAAAPKQSPGRRAAKVRPKVAAKPSKRALSGAPRASASVRRTPGSGGTRRASARSPVTATRKQATPAARKPAASGRRNALLARTRPSPRAGTLSRPQKSAAPVRKPPSSINPRDAARLRAQKKAARSKSSTVRPVPQRRPGAAKRAAPSNARSPKAPSPRRKRVEARKRQPPRGASPATRARPKAPARRSSR